MKFKTGVVLILSATTLGLETRMMTMDAVAETQEEKAPTLSPSTVTSRTVSISGPDFLNYFQRNGSAAHFDYDIANTIQTLTPNQKHQSGNVTLKTKVDMSQDFTFTGFINLGNKSSSFGGADGVGFLFHPGNTDVVGRDGGAAGIGGVIGAFGFKLDTYYNANSETSFNPDPSEFAPGQAYGAFVDGTSSVAQTIDEGAQVIAQPSYNQFKPFKMSYDGTSKIMTVTYDGQTWQQDVSQLIGNNHAMSFSISASTGDNYNLQQLQISNFQYTIAQGMVNAHYIDEAGKTLKAVVTTSGDIKTLYTTSQAKIPGYTFKEVTGAAPAGTYQANVQNVNYIYTRNQGLATITYIDDKTGQALDQKAVTGAAGEKATYTTATDIATYLHQGYQLVSDNYPKTNVTFSEQPQAFEVHLTHQFRNANESKLVKQIVHYQYKNGAEAAPDYMARPLKFTRTVITDQATGTKVAGAWTAINGTTFEKVISPDFKGFTPDQKQIAAIDKVTGDTADRVNTVVYTANREAAKVTYLDDTRHQVLSQQELTGEFGTSDVYRTADTIKQYEAKGFKLVSDNYPASGVLYDQEGIVKHYDIHLAHQTSAKSDTKTVNETVHYQFKNGDKAAADYTAVPIRFTRPVITDQVTQNQIKGNWLPVGDTTFASVVSPLIKGVTPDQAQIDAVTAVTGDTADIVKTVVYAATPETAQVTYLDDTTSRTLSNQALTGDFGTRDSYRTAETLKKYQDKGYELVSDTYPASGVVYDEDGQVKYYEVHLKHPILVQTETKQVNEVVHYRYQNGEKATPDFLATPLQFIRTVTSDQVTGVQVAGDWLAVNGTTFGKVVSPNLKAYVPDQPQIAAIDKVSGETKDIVKTVIYTAIQQPKQTPKQTVMKTPKQTVIKTPKHTPKQAPSVPQTAVASPTVKKMLPDTGAKSGIAEAILGTVVFLTTFGLMIVRKKR